MEKFPEPSQWYERRLAYTKSVATNSIGKFQLSSMFPDLDKCLCGIVGRASSAEGWWFKPW